MHPKGLLVLLISISILLASTGTPQAAETAKGAPGGQPKVFKIGVVNPVTGPAAEYGLQLLRPLQLKIEEVNAAGGVTIAGEKYRLEIVGPYDDKSSPDGGRAAAERLANEDKVKIVAGSASSAATLGALPVLRANKIICITTSTQPVIQDKYSFRMAPEWGTVSAATVYKYIVEKGHKNIVLTATDDEAGWTEAAGAITVLQSLNAKLLGLELVNPETTDFAPLITRVLALKPEVWGIHTLHHDKKGLFIHQARQMGYKGLFCFDDWDTDLVLKSATVKDVEGILTSSAAMGSDYDAYKQKYQARFGQWNPGAAWNVVMGEMLIKALSITKGLQPDDLVAAFENVGNVKVLGGEAYLGGKARSGIAHQAIIPGGVTQMQNGKMVLVANVAPAEPPSKKTLKELGYK